MATIKSLTAAAFALAVPAVATAALGLPTPAAADTTFEASPSTPTTTAPTAPTVVAGERHAPGDGIRRPLGELTTEGELPEWFDLRHAPRDLGGGRSGGPAGGADSYSAGPWCNVQCITKGVAYLHGSGVEIVVETSVPVQLFVSVVRDTNGDGDYDFSEFTTSQGQTTELSWVLEDLEPGATYYGMAAATDIYGNTSYGWGHFTMPS